MLEEELLQSAILVLDCLTLACDACEGLLKIKDFMLDGFDVKLLPFTVSSGGMSAIGMSRTWGR